MESASLKRERPDRDEHFLNRARVTAERSTCLRRKIGAVIVRDGVELSSGYVGAPRGSDHCTDIGTCLRTDLGIPHGQRYELCRSVHAEQNAIINAARIGISIVGGTMYVSSQTMKGAYDEKTEGRKIYGPCLICKKEIINAGLKAVYVREEDIGSKLYEIEEIRQLVAEEEEEWRRKRDSGIDITGQL